MTPTGGFAGPNAPQGYQQPGAGQAGASQNFGQPGGPTEGWGRYQNPLSWPLVSRHAPWMSLRCRAATASAMHTALTPSSSSAAGTSTPLSSGDCPYAQ